MDASGSGDNGKYCGKTLRKPDNADGKDDTDDTDDTEQCERCERCERCELVRIGNPMDWQTGRRKRRKDRAKKTGLRKRRPYDPARKPD